MPFQYILANLLAKNDDAFAALFLDETGETIGMACADYTPFEMKVVGAYLGIYLRQMDSILGGAKMGLTEFLHIQKDDIHLFAAPLPDSYYLVLAQRGPALLARSRRTLLAACDAIKQEVFS